MRIEQCSDAQLFYSVLVEFEDCFPHLTEKVSSLSEYAQKVVRYGKVLLSMEKDEVTGLCAFYDNNIDSKIGYITLIGVQKNYQKRKIGKRLLKDCEDSMRKNGMVQVQLEVDDDNEVAKYFYEQKGYQEVGKASTSSFFMLKQL